MSLNNKQYDVVISAGHHVDRKGKESPHYPQFNEHDVATKVVADVVKELEKLGCTVGVVSGKLPVKVAGVNKLKPKLAVELHFNADDDHSDPLDKDSKRGHGCSVMYYPNSLVRKRQAIAASRSLADALGVRDNGGQEGWYWGNGTVQDYFLRKTVCPSFILEPFFMDNEAEVRTFLVQNKHVDLVDAVFNSVVELLRQVGD
jgi:N-acetylmuramoyl-L-alanine amidase